LVVVVHQVILQPQVELFQQQLFLPIQLLQLVVGEVVVQMDLFQVALVVQVVVAVDILLLQKLQEQVILLPLVRLKVIMVEQQTLVIRVVVVAVEQHVQELPLQVALQVELVEQEKQVILQAVV
tara:strand:+ start:224 stop:595 length:372 start_codon:yes stop_codon:yes gene_type:complete